jgi:8-oxo-dGTP pyrophosphatase MutT (NUDIX family)
VDLSYAMGQHAQGAPFVQADAIALPFADRSIGHLVMRSMLHFVPARQALTEAARTLTPRGHLVVAQKILPAETDAYDWYDALFRLRNPMGGRLGTEADLGTSLESAGLSVLRTQYFCEQRKVQLERWITKDGTAPKENQREVERLILNPPECVLRETKHRIQDGVLYFERTWAVIYCRRDSGPLTAPVIAMLVERIQDGTPQVLLQRRRKRFEEPSYVDSWEVPQGRVQRHVSVLETMDSELRDETGLELEAILSPCRLDRGLDDRYKDPVEAIVPAVVVRTLGGTDFVAIAIRVRAHGTPRSIDIDRGYNWVSAAELRTLLERDLVYPLNRPMLDAYLKLLESEK